MTRKVVKAIFVHTQSYQILFDLEDCEFGRSGGINTELLEEICWDAVDKNEGLVLGVSSHVSWDLIDVPDLKMPKIPEKIGPGFIVDENGLLIKVNGKTDE